MTIQRRLLGLLCLVPLGSAGCGSTPSSAAPHPKHDAAATDSSAEASVSDASPEADASPVSDASPEADAAPVSCDEKAKNCASSFGSLFTKSDGRADGTLVALVRPVDQQCAMPNSTHVVLELSIQGQVQRLVVSVNGVAVKTASAALLGPAWAEGWHQNVALDYPSYLGVHSADFKSVTLDGGVAFICNHMTIGSKVSVYAYSDGSEPSSAHQVHRNDNYPDGAIVPDPTAPNPTYLLFRYANQTF